MSAVRGGMRRVAAAEEAPEHHPAPPTTIAVRRASEQGLLKEEPGAADDPVGGAGLGTDGNHPCSLRRQPRTRRGVRQDPRAMLSTDRGRILTERLVALSVRTLDARERCGCGSKRGRPPSTWRLPSNAPEAWRS